MRITILDAINKIKKKEINGKELLQECYKNYQKYEDLNILISNQYSELIENCPDNAIPINLKDNFFLKGTKTTSGSKIMSNFDSPFDGTVVTRLKKNINAIFPGKTNLDEFTMGSTGKTSFFGPTKNPWKNKKGEYFSPGGSSSGSAASLVAGACLASTGSDTGGSIRQPASWSGLIGYKPTYGVLSRYGTVSLLVKTDSLGFFTYTVEDCEYLFNNVKGICEKDYTSAEYKAEKHTKKVIGIIKNFSPSPEMEQTLEETKVFLEKEGYTFKEFSIEMLDLTLSLYYLYVCSGAASELGKFDGIFYGDSKKRESLEDIYEECRTDCLGEEVQRRVLVGNYMTYSANIENYYGHADRILSLIWEQFKKAFEEVDLFLCPTSPSEPMLFEKTLEVKDPIEIYGCDLYTTFVNLLGLCGLNIPIKLGPTGGPLGIQLVGKPFGDSILFEVGNKIDRHFNFCKNILWREII